jgi:hypothetical protein
MDREIFVKFLVCELQGDAKSDDLFDYRKFSINETKEIYFGHCRRADLLAAKRDAMPKKYGRQRLAEVQTVSEWIIHSIVKLE